MSLPQGSVKDRHVDWLLARKWIEPIMFVVQGANATAGAPVTLTSGFNGSTTTAQLLEVGGGNFAALQFSGANSATASYVWRPQDVDNRWPIYVRLAWSSDAQANSVATFTTTFGLFGNNALPSSITTAYTTAVVTDAKSLNGRSWTWTRWGVLAGPLATGPFAFETFPTTVQAIGMNFAVSTMSPGAIATDFVWLYGVELAYTPRRTWGDGSGREARYLEQPLQIGPSEGGAQFGIRR